MKTLSISTPTDSDPTRDAVTLQEELLTQRFYFDLKNGQEFIRDEEGVEAHDIDQATEEAQVVLDEMRGSKDLSFSGEGWNLVIRDESGASLKTLPIT